MPRVRLLLDVHWTSPDAYQGRWDADGPGFSSTIALRKTSEAAEAPKRGGPLALIAASGERVEFTIRREITLDPEGTYGVWVTVSTDDKAEYLATIARMVDVFEFELPGYLGDDERYWEASPSGSIRSDSSDS